MTRLFQIEQVCAIHTFPVIRKEMETFLQVCATHTLSLLLKWNFIVLVISVSTTIN